MSGPCHTCHHFRAQRRLRDALRLPTSLGVAQALQTAIQTDETLLGEESAQKRMQMTAQRDQWPFRPSVESYCGLDEESGVWYIHEIRNMGQRCDAHAPYQGPPRSCQACRFNIAPTGQQADHQNVLEVISPLNSYDSQYGGPQKIMNDLQTVMNVGQTQQAHEMLEALQGGGTMTRVPQYYAWCERYSTAGAYVIASARNADGRCGGWQGAGAPGLPAQGASPPSWPAAPQQPHDPWQPPPQDPPQAPQRPPSQTFRNLAKRLIRELNKK